MATWVKWGSVEGSVGTDVYERRMMALLGQSHGRTEGWNGSQGVVIDTWV